MNLPNILSISRIFLFVLIILLFENGFFLFSLFTFIIAALTDYFDGYFARKNNQTSKVGSLLDLIADKIFVSSLLIWMTFSRPYTSTCVLVVVLCWWSVARVLIRQQRMQPRGQRCGRLFSVCLCVIAK